MTWFRPKLEPPGCTRLTPPVASPGVPSSSSAACVSSTHVTTGSMTHYVLRSPMSVQESATKHTTVLCIALTEREKTGGSFQCLASVWRHFVPREGGLRSTRPPVNWSPQSTCPLGSFPLTNLLVDKFTWRPNKWSPIITTFNYMVPLTPWNDSALNVTNCHS